MWARLRKWYRSTFGPALAGAILLWIALPPLGVYVLPWPDTPRLGLPPIGSALLAWIAPVWWVLLIRRAELPGRRPYMQLWLAGFLFWLAAVHWLRLPHWLTGFGWVALSAYLAFYLPVFVGLGRVAVHRLRFPVILGPPIVWTGLELVRGHLFGGFTMASLEHTQYRWIELIQMSDLAGAYGLGFVMMFVAACLARTVPCDEAPRLRGRRSSWSYWPLLPAVGLLAAVLAYGHVRVGPEDHGSAEMGTGTGSGTGSEVQIALVQGSVDVVMNPEPGTREKTHRQYEQLSEEAVRRWPDLDLIVWPETIFATRLFDYTPGVPVPADWPHSEPAFRWWLGKQSAESRQRARDLAQRLDTSLLVGVPTEYLDADGVKCFNSAAFVPRDDAPIGRYDKMLLVLFGEYVPLAKHCDWLVRLTPLSNLGGGLEPGTEPVDFDLDGLRIAPNICYESVVPHLIRRHVNGLAQKGREPHVLVNLTNDGWFWGSSELDMHLTCGVFRAVECRKPFLIAANTGFSAWIDSDGRIRAAGPRRATGLVLARVSPETRSSWYLTCGDWPAGICLGGCLALGVVGTWNRLRDRRKNRRKNRRKIEAKPSRLFRLGRRRSL